VKLDMASMTACEDYVRTLVDVESNENVHNRACHNLWVFNNEVKRFREEQRKGVLDSFVESRLTGTRYFAAFHLARNLRVREDPSHPNGVR
jgi:queuine/archaeosine tRNA-ribosyltransferase